MAFWTRGERRGTGSEHRPGGTDDAVPGPRAPLGPWDAPGDSPTSDDPTLIPRPLDHDRVAQAIRRRGDRVAVDEDGDLMGLWNTRLFWFLVSPGERSVLQVRGHWNREMSIERLDEALEVCNTWNEDRFWPKCYARVRDNGSVLVCTELTTSLEGGMSDAQLDLVIACGLATSHLFFDDLDARFPDPVALPPR